MHPKERLEKCLKREETDRPPVDYLAKPEMDRRLRDALGVDSETALLDALGVDFYYHPFRDISQNESCLPMYRGPRLSMEEERRVCPFGIGWTRGAGNAKFAVDEAIFAPLATAQTEKDVLGHLWPKPEWFDMEPAIAACEEAGQRVLVGGFWSGIFGDSYRMRGFEQFLGDMAMSPALTRTLVNRMTDFYLELNDRLFTALKGCLDVFFFGNDYGSQRGLLFSAAMWEEFFFENTRRLADLAHGYGLKVMMHSCGSIAPLIPRLVDAGVDILDPIQVTAENMDPKALKKAFGDRIVFHGGVDTQGVLPYSSPEAVRTHAEETLQILGKTGGYIFAPSQILDVDIPTENVLAMYETAKDGSLCTG